MISTITVFAQSQLIMFSYVSCTALTADRSTRHTDKHHLKFTIRFLRQAMSVQLNCCKVCKPEVKQMQVYTKRPRGQMSRKAGLYVNLILQNIQEAVNEHCNSVREYHVRFQSTLFILTRSIENPSFMRKFTLTSVVWRVEDGNSEYKSRSPSLFRS